MGKYLDPRADLTFKKVFGEHKHLVISLLNALLPLKDDERVESIEYWPADQIPERTEAEKYSIVHVCCKDNKQREFIVEMQRPSASARCKCCGSASSPKSTTKRGRLPQNCWRTPK